MARGMGMGAADVIPGVSGGTIAFITGIYQELVNSIRSVNTAFFRLLFSKGIPAAWKHVNGTFLVSVLGGILVSIFSLARLLSWLLAHYQALVWAFFFGLIVGSALFIGRKITAWNLPAILLLLGGTGAAYLVTISTPATTTEAWWFIFLTGSIAICAMILPGISGSFILLLLGKYEFMMHAVRDLKADILAVFALGCLAGIIAFSHVISWLFRKYPDATMALLAGFMIGSLNKLWPWKEVLSFREISPGEIIPLAERSISPARFEALYQTDPMLWQALACAVAGMAIIFLFERAGKKHRHA
jgi:putative membrane protein